MKKPRDPVIVAALEYEKAVLHALPTLEGMDIEAQRAACLQWADALTAIEALAAEDYNRAGDFLTKRGRVPDDGWKTIYRAMQMFFDTVEDPLKKLN